MVSTLFSDEIVNVSKFRGSQSRWLSMAAKRPITITNGDTKLTVLNRELVKNLYLQKYYLELIVQFCDEVDTGKAFKALPWLTYLDGDEKKEFFTDLMSAIMEAITVDRWDGIEEVIEDWKATAETESNEEAMAAINSKVSKDKYIPRKPK